MFVRKCAENALEYKNIVALKKCKSEIEKIIKATTNDSLS